VKFLETGLLLLCNEVKWSEVLRNRVTIIV